MSSSPSSFASMVTVMNRLGAKTLMVEWLWFGRESVYPWCRVKNPPAQRKRGTGLQLPRWPLCSPERFATILVQRRPL